jgi:cytoskeletal protein RodZ
VNFEYGSDDATSIGQLLKSVRIRKELAIEEVAESLKIHRRFLTAIEDDRYEDLPGPIYKDLFLKAYSDYLGIDLEEALLRLPEPQARPEQEDSARGNEPTRNEREREIRSDIRKMPTAAAGGIKRTRTHMLFLAIVAIAIVIALVVIMQFGSGTTVPPSRTPIESSKQPAVIPDSVEQTSTASALERIMIRVESTDSCYAEVYADAESIEVGFVLPDDPIRCTMQDSFWIKLGVPAVARIWVDSLPMRLWPASERGVVAATVTRENYLDFVDSTLLLEWQ